MLTKNIKDAQGKYSLPLGVGIQWLVKKQDISPESRVSSDLYTNHQSGLHRIYKSFVEYLPNYKVNL